MENSEPHPQKRSGSFFKKKQHKKEELKDLKKELIMVHIIGYFLFYPVTIVTCFALINSRPNIEFPWMNW